MSYKPLGRRVLVRPDAETTVTPGGLHIPETNQVDRPMSGIVVALGPLCSSPAAEVAEALIDRVAAHLGDDGRLASRLSEALHDVAMTYADDRWHGLKVGQAVAFPYTVGTVMPTLMDFQIGDESYILIDERDIVAVWDPTSTIVDAVA